VNWRASLKQDIDIFLPNFEIIIIIKLLIYLALIGFSGNPTSPILAEAISRVEYCN
jgi:hypothetical protein